MVFHNKVEQNSEEDPVGLLVKVTIDVCGVSYIKNNIVRLSDGVKSLHKTLFYRPFFNDLVWLSTNSSDYHFEEMGANLIKT